MVLKLKVALVSVVLMVSTLTQQVEEKPEPELMRVTCYLPTGNKTASGVYPEEGMCASNWSNMGKIAVLYDMDMNYIGEFKVTDTGSAKSLKNGTSIDVYRESRASMNDWIGTYGDYCYVVWKEIEDGQN